MSEKQNNEDNPDSKNDILDKKDEKDSVQFTIIQFENAKFFENPLNTNENNEEPQENRELINNDNIFECSDCSKNPIISIYEEKLKNELDYLNNDQKNELELNKNIQKANNVQYQNNNEYKSNEQENLEKNKNNINNDIINQKKDINQNDNSSNNQKENNDNNVTENNKNQNNNDNINQNNDNINQNNNNINQNKNNINQNNNNINQNNDGDVNQNNNINQNSGVNQNGNNINQNNNGNINQINNDNINQNNNDNINQNNNCNINQNSNNNINQNNNNQNNNGNINQNNNISQYNNINQNNNNINLNYNNNNQNGNNIIENGNILISPNNNNDYNENNQNNINENIQNNNNNENKVFNNECSQKIKINVSNKNNSQNLNKDNINLNLIKTCLKNFGESSYLNVILQCLANIECLKIFFLKENIYDYIVKNIAKIPFSFVFSRIIKHFYVKRDKLYSLEHFLRVLVSKEPKYGDKNEPKNINDCLIFIIKRLHQELNRLKNNKKNIDETKYKDINDAITYGFINYKNTDDSIISDNFNFLEIKEFNHIFRREKSYILQSDNIFKINISYFKKIFKKLTIFNCLDFEMNTNQNISCQTLQNHEQITISSLFYLLPKIFVFVFILVGDNDKDENIKNLQFALEEKINLSKYIFNKNEKSPKYELIGAAYKKGEKYVNYCKSFENQQWYYYHDEKVENIKSDKFIRNNTSIPCFLIYKSID